jgi:hypothetical protein
MTRTDIHRPSVIVPDDYDFVGFRYDGISRDELHANVMWRREIANHMEKTGGDYSFHSHGGSCHVCGANALYLGIFHHRPSNQYVCVGEDCADKLGSGDWDAFRSNVKRGKDALAGKAKAMAVLSDLNLSEAWGIFDGAITIPDSFERDTICDMVGNLIRYGSLTDKQVVFLTKLVSQGLTIEQRRAERKQADAASQHVGKVGERAAFDLTVSFVTSYDTAYGTMFVHGLKDASGNVLIYKGKNIAFKGDAIKGKFTVKEHAVREGVNQTILSHPKLG